MELREMIARTISNWPGHVDGFTRDSVYSEAAHERWKATAFAQADEILALRIHDSDCATHNEPAMPNGLCDCSLSR
jgi:hypothetical protein